jgi:hypothetical protein
MRVCEIIDGLVVNIVELPAGYVIAPDGRSASGSASYEVQGPDGTELVAYEASFAPAGAATLVASAEAQPGWGWDGEAFIPPAIAEPELPPLGPISRRQMRLTLLAHGLLELVEPAIANLPEPERSAALIEWQDASEYQRDHPLIEQIGGALQLSPEQVDALWREAMAR